ncbi:MAG: SH3 domain-containing protein [Verrucomicrobiota bacterium]|nr:SH3 domain-containing protein [Verrucomicrobiota bacterium]
MFRLLFGLCTAVSLYAASAKENPVPQAQVKPFQSFTGRVIADKVRLRARPDLESKIVKQLGKGDLLLVIGEEGEFYAVRPPKETKGYVFRSYVLEGRVEAERVNVRLEPNLEAPIIGQLQAGDRIKGTVSDAHPKWLEIAAPSGSSFFVAREYVTSAGGPDLAIQHEKRASEVDQLMDEAFRLAEKECEKSYEAMEITRVTDAFQAIISRYSDFPQAVSKAKEALAVLHETHLHKKIAWLENRMELSQEAKEELLTQCQKEPFSSAHFWSQTILPKEKELWNALEESLYLSWTAFHTGKEKIDFYKEQAINGTTLNGSFTAYDASIRDCPGEFLFTAKDGSHAYLYSTQVDLARFTGKQVSLVVSPRPNNHFAFPAYFVLECND